MNQLFYKPDKGWVGDVIPYYKDGKFALFYLFDNRDRANLGTSWHMVSTDDFVHFEEHGPVLPCGEPEDQDRNAFTGSILEKDGVYHLYYTGYNPAISVQGSPLQVVMHAVSHDLLHWEKRPEDLLYPDTSIYELHDWRDPYVFWNEEDQAYWMLLAARVNEGPNRRRGCIGLCVSKDLKEWEVREPFWSPGLYLTHECPDLFKMGDWWYLVYSTFSEKFVTHYRMSKTLQGPWLAPENDSFDSRAFYAGKTFSDGATRYIFGWNPTKERENDYKDWEWAGSLVIHELVQQPDGSLGVKPSRKIEDVFASRLALDWSPGIGDWSIDKNSLRISAAESFACIGSRRDMPLRCILSGKVRMTAGTRGCGIMLRASDDYEQAYYIRFEPGRSRLVFDMWPRKIKEEGADSWQINGDKPYLIELERPIEGLSDSWHEFKVIIEDSICVVYVDDWVALSARLYNLRRGKWGFFVSEGEAQFADIEMAI
ncbi:family 43 glycosylhydrolase [Paenibacillaceae bacterium WGS1546]|uniref:family 43 glycosylhydrolase n=1 Tax=Cohnella sp. WGS1546 TaxID=3366810 RepID=UPI00372D4DDB